MELSGSHARAAAGVKSFHGQDAGATLIFEDEGKERKKSARRLAETVVSVLRLYLGKRVQAVTVRRLILKIMMAIISYDLHCLSV
ncbi:MAG: hypothetical protein NZ937_04785 [Armatimonadetes bacterium]|nr:hypothetical protein [Armatimonadota bacterium]